MTYDLGRDLKAPEDVNPSLPQSEESSGGTGQIAIVVALVAAVVGWFIYVYPAKNASNVDTTDLRPPITQPAPSTTGSHAQGQ